MPRPAIAKDHELGGLNQRFMVSLFWSPEARDQGVSSVGTFGRL